MSESALSFLLILLLLAGNGLLILLVWWVHREDKKNKEKEIKDAPLKLQAIKRKLEFMVKMNSITPQIAAILRSVIEGEIK